MSLSCEQAKRELWRRLDGELSESAGERLGAHLESCGPCRSESAELKAFDSFLADSCALLEPGPAFARDTMSAITARRTTAQRLSFARLAQQLTPFAAR